jgi:hypothetical protein
MEESEKNDLILATNHKSEQISEMALVSFFKIIAKIQLS